MKHKLIAFLIMAFMQGFAFAQDNVVSKLYGLKGNYEISDIGQLSDGGSTFVEIKHADLTVFLSKGAQDRWEGSVIEDDNKERYLDIDNDEVDGLLIDWIKNRYSCSAIKENLES